MVNLHLKQSKKLTLIMILLVVITGVVLFFALSQNDDKQNILQTAPEAKTKESSDPMAPVDSIKAPAATVPKECDYDEPVRKIIGESFTKSGNSAKTKNSFLIRCDYRKGEKIITVQQYEYANDSEAKADLSKVASKGSAVKNKGKYTMVVIVVSASNPDLEAANSIVDIGLGRL